MTTSTSDVFMAEALAESWERRREQIEEISTPVHEWMLRELRPREGDTVLELAAGTGDTGFQAAAAVGPRGRLISSDRSPAMLAAGRRRGAELGVENVEYRLLDAERLDLGTASVDGVLCRFGYMLMQDPTAALAETRRVLRPGGRLTLAVWGAPERNPFFTASMMALVQGGHVTPPQPGEPGIFALADAERLTALLEAAGFGEVRAEEVPVRFELPSIEEYVQMMADTAGPIALALRALSDAERAAVTARCAAALERFAAGGGYRIPGVVVCAVAS